MMTHGYSIIALDNPKSNINVGSAMRAVGVYGASALFVSGKRIKPKLTDPMKYYRHIPLFFVEDLHRGVVPFDCVPVAVDIIDGAMSLSEYKHPERAFYVFGGEDATLGKRVLSWCRDIIYIPTERCMNLAATVNVVLYDRLSKLLNQAQINTPRRGRGMKAIGMIKQLGGNPGGDEGG